MQRGGYDQIPDRIIPPYGSILDPSSLRRAEFEPPRAGRILDPPRQPLLGDVPDYMGYARPSYAYNGPVINSEPLRRRGFDKGPYGEDLTTSRPEGRQPLLKTPNLAVERIGGDMEIARSRSSSPVRIVNARSVRDDRKKDRTRARKSRSRSRSRSRERDRGHRDRRDREREREKEPTVANGTVRDGIVWTSDNYYEFLAFFVTSLNSKVENSTDRDIQGQRKLCENVSRATELEKTKIILPPDFNSSDRERMLYCDTTIEGLPSAIFFGSGYGPRAHYAKYSAAKDLIDKCHRIGVINSELHAAIGECPRLDRMFQKHFSMQISKAVNAVILLIKRMSHESLPAGFMKLRQLEPAIIDRFKIILRMVMIDVYYQGVDSPANVPKALETGPGDRGRDNYSGGSSSSGRRNDKERPSSLKEEAKDDIDDRVPVRQRREDVIAEKERELKDKMERELAKKRAEMEQEIRQKIVEEERAKIRAELEMEKKIEAMMAQQQQYQNEREKEKREREELEKKVENDFNSTVGQLEQRFVEIRGKKLDNVHDMIQKSAAFKALQACSSTLTSLTIEQKQQLTVDLKSLLDYITFLTDSSNNQPGMGYTGNSSSRYQTPPTHSHPSVAPVGYPVGGLVAAPNHAGLSSRPDQIRRLTVGDMRLRSLTASEQLHLRTGSKVIAQDMKTGNWNLASVVKVHDDRVTLTVGTTTWKKYLDEVYIEDKNTLY